MRAVRNELVGSVDADCAADKMWLESLLPLFEDPKIAGAGGRLIESFRESLADRWRCVHMRMDRGTERIRNPLLLHGCNSVFRKSAIVSVGGYDETLLTAGDDADISRRLTLSGWEILYEPAARVTHLRRDSMASVLRSYWQWTHFGFGRDERVARLKLHNIIRHCFLGNVRYLFGGLATDDLRNGRFELLWIDFMTLLYFPWRDLQEWGRLRKHAQN
jgi:GT2 family glycosyltransferase